MTVPIAHVLVLEDDEGLLALARRVLTKQGHRVTAVADAESAHAAVQQERPDLLIVDYNLQALESGLDFFRSLRASGVEIPAIMVSGVSDELRIIEALRAGVADVLPKTSDYLDHLPQSVQRVLEQQSQVRQAVQQLQRELDALLAAQREAEAEIARLRNARETFLTTLSHELRTPLNAILGWTQYLLRDATDPAGLNKGLQVIERNARLQAQRVEELLDANRVLSGTLRLAAEPVVLAELVRDAMLAAESAAAAKEIALRAESAEGTVVGDAARLRQVLGKLLGNAIRFTPPRGWVLLCLHRHGSEIELEVRDSGQGMEDAELARLFPPSQAAAGRLGSAAELGLGLAVIRQLVELHGGRLRAASAGPGQGASFFVRLPLAA